MYDVYVYDIYVSCDVHIYEVCAYICTCVCIRIYIYMYIYTARPNISKKLFDNIWARHKWDLENLAKVMPI